MELNRAGEITTYKTYTFDKPFYSTYSETCFSYRESKLKEIITTKSKSLRNAFHLSYFIHTICSFNNL